MTGYPTSLDTLTNPTAEDYLDSPDHATQHANANDAIEALQAKVGVNGSSVVTSLDFMMSTSRFINVMDHGAVRDNVTDNIAAFQALLDAAAAETDGAIVFAPRGRYKLTSGSLNVYENTILQGEGKEVTRLNFTTNGDGIKSTWAINSSTSVQIALRDLKLDCSHANPQGGGFADVGGTFWEIINCDINGWKYGVILDQSEIIRIVNSGITNNTEAGMWLVNGAEHTVGAAGDYTNRISVYDCQFSNPSAYNIKDQGGVCHYYINNNFEGGNRQIEIDDGRNVVVMGNEMENAASANVYVVADKGASQNIKIVDNFMSSNDNISAINISDVVNRMTIGDNYFGANAATKIVGCSNVTNLFLPPTNVNNGAGALTDGYATRHFAPTTMSFLSGSGSPEGVVPAGAGSIYVDTDGGAGVTLYIKESGAGNTGWIAK